jgi:hypothetical protein
LRAPYRIVGDRQAGSGVSACAWGENDFDVAIGARLNAGAVVGLAEFVGVRSAKLYSRYIQNACADVVHGYGQRRANGSDRLRWESQG